MNVIVFQDEAYQHVLQELRKMVQDAVAELVQDEWLEPEDAKKLLGVQKSKLQQLRDSGEILFSQHGRKIKYSRKSINAFLLRHVPKFKSLNKK